MTDGCRQFAQERVIIMSAPNGARRSQDDHAALPITPAELADNAEALCAAGVSILHLHVRDEQGQHTLDPGRYRDALTAIRERVGEQLILQVTTEAVGRYSADEQMAVVRELKPEAVSLALREICPSNDKEAAAATFFAWLTAANIWPQYILYSAADVQRFDSMRRRGVFAEDSPFALFVLGNYVSGVAGQVADLDSLLRAVNTNLFPWAVCCFGGNEHAVMQSALRQGGHVRIGFENNVQLADGSEAVDNAALIGQFTASLTDQRRQPAAAAEVRKAFDL